MRGPGDDMATRGRPGEAACIARRARCQIVLAFIVRVDCELHRNAIQLRELHVVVPRNPMSRYDGAIHPSCRMGTSQQVVSWWLLAGALNSSWGAPALPLF